MFSTGKARHMLNYLLQHPDFTDDWQALTAGLPEAQVQILQDYAKILLLQQEELYGDVENAGDLQLDNEVTRLQARLIEQYIKHSKQNLTRKLASADEASTRQILLQVKELDELRNHANQQAGKLSGGSYG